MVSRPAQQGIVLIPVLTALAIIAAIVLLLDLQQGMLAQRMNRQHDLAVANAVAEAGLRDALWQVRKGATYPNPVNGTLPGHGAYEAKITKDLANPAKITIESTALIGNSARVKLDRTYTLGCPNGTTTTLLTNYVENPHSITENYQSSLQKGYLHPRNNTNDRSRSLLWFNYGNTIPSKATIASATLMVDVQQHDAAMEGASLYANRVLQAWGDKDAEWRYATGKTAWGSPDGKGGHYTLVDEASTPIAPGTVTYAIDINAIMQAWVNGSTNYGVILRSDGITTGGSSEFRLKKNSGSWPSTQWPRLQVKWC